MSKKNSELEVSEAVDRATKDDDENLIRLSTGVVLRGKKANPLTLIKVMASFPRPKPPTWKNPAFGNREMENPDDPEYQAQLKSWEMEQSNATLNALILLGTELVSVPRGYSKPDNDDWVEDYRLLGVPVSPENKRWRYLTWVMSEACKDEHDLVAIQEVVGRLSGVRDSTVQTAEQFSGSD